MTGLTQGYKFDSGLRARQKVAIEKSARVPIKLRDGVGEDATREGTRAC
jgi:hypothetical protein